LAKGLWRALAGVIALFVFPSLGQAANPAAPAASVSTSAFLSHAAAVNKFQLAASQLALRKTQAEIVHGFAHQIILDYSVAGMSLRTAAADAKLPLREALDEPHKALLDALTRTPPGKTLSKAYFETEEKTLRADLAVFEAYAQSGDNERLQIFAQEMVPVMKSQLEQLAKLRK
jgi:putative membrane protein